MREKPAQIDDVYDAERQFGQTASFWARESKANFNVEPARSGPSWSYSTWMAE